MANIERLNLLLDLLKSEQADPKHEFCLTGYVDDAARVARSRAAADRVGDDWREPSTSFASVSEHPCGTVCCALGLASLDPQFNALGFTFDEELGTPTFPNPGDNYMAKTLLGLAAGAAMLDITHDAACWLFTPQRYPNLHATTIEEVIQRLQVTINDLETRHG